MIDSRGDKTIGPRPELIEEIENYCPGIFFWMYTPERFAERGGIHLRLAADDKAVQEIKSVSSEAPHGRMHFMSAFAAERAVLEWIHKHRGHIVSNSTQIAPGVEVDAIYKSYSRGTKVGVEIKITTSGSNLIGRFDQAIVSIGRLSDKINEIDEFLLVVVADRSSIVRLFGRYADVFSSIISRPLEIVAGVLEYNNDNEPVFMPILEIPINGGFGNNENTDIVERST